MIIIPESNLFVETLDLDPRQDLRLLERTDQRPSISRFITLGHDESRVLDPSALTIFPQDGIFSP